MNHQLSKRFNVRRWVFAAFLLTSLSAPAALGIDAAKSKVTATFKQMNVPVEGIFTKASGSIQFDAAKPEAASASIQIDTAGFDLGMDDYNAEVRKKEWLLQSPSASHFCLKQLQGFGC